MNRWMVANLPSGLLLALLVVVIAGGAALTQLVVRARFPGLNGGDHNDATKFTYGFIGFVYAFFVGFVVSSMWSQTNTADANARAEGAAGVQIARAITMFDEPDRDRVRQALLAYEQAAITEWDRADAGSSIEADSALTTLQGRLREVRATSDAQKSALTTSLSNLDQLSRARTVRILTAVADTGPPWPIWVVILVTSALVVGTVIVYGVDRAALHYPMVGVASVIVAANLFLVLELSHPYLGAIACSSDPLAEVVRTVERS